MWTANIKAVKNVRDLISLDVEFTNGVEEDTYIISFEARTKEEAERTIANQISNLTARDTEITSIKIGEFTPTPVVEKVVVPPTEEQIAEATWNEAKRKLNLALGLKRTAVEAGREVNPERQVEIDGLAEFVDVNFKSEYVR
jgi:hypothetical protein|tara:strand:- start:1469 stop:1894 length:426 start_codon:yes stop_codon:yes gene_type:complete